MLRQRRNAPTPERERPFHPEDFNALPAPIRVERRKRTIREWMALRLSEKEQS